MTKISKTIEKNLDRLTALRALIAEENDDTQFDKFCHERDALLPSVVPVVALMVRRLVAAGIVSIIMVIDGSDKFLICDQETAYVNNNGTITISGTTDGRPISTASVAPIPVIVPMSDTGVN